ncbi:MAG: YHS domain-containing protein [Deltaproteobacteria bacterium]|nr:YHS domain-containing protein [Deltaproteobacteria bacterium]
MGLIRLIIIGVLAYVIFRTIKSLMAKGPAIRPPRRDRQAGMISDELVKDPFCETYVPLGDAYRVVYKGEELAFCSKDCAEKYLKSRERV